MVEHGQRAGRRGLQVVGDRREIVVVEDRLSSILRQEIGEDPLREAARLLQRDQPHQRGVGLVIGEHREDGRRGVARAFIDGDALQARRDSIPGRELIHRDSSSSSTSMLMSR